MKSVLRSVAWLIAVTGLICTSAVAQVSIQEPDTIFLCEPGPVTLHAVYASVDSSQLVAGNALNNIDDAYSGIINLGFPFTFYGNTYTQCLLSTNGYITFDLSDANGYSPWSINNPIPSPNNPVNSIMGPWHDTYPNAPSAAAPGWVIYTTTGTAPNRVFIFNMCMVPMFSCVSQCFSSQTKLYESTNIIEFHIGHKDLCSGWNSGQAILGIQNATGTEATVVNGYNSGVQWTADNVAYQLTPNGTTYSVTNIPYSPTPVYSTSQLQWSMNGSNVGTGDSLAIPVTQSGYATVGFAGCFGLGSGGCGTTSSISGADSVYIALNYGDFIQSQRVSACNRDSDNAVFIQFPTNVNGPYDLTWTDSLGTVLRAVTDVVDIDSLSILPAGTYHLAVTNDIGCTFGYDYVIPVRTMAPSFTYSPSLICQLAPVQFTNASTGAIDRYTWYFGDTNVDTAANPTHAYSITGDSILVSLQIHNDTFPDCIFIDTMLLEVHPNIVAAAFVDSPRCAGINIFMKDKSLPFPATWQWFDGDSLISSDSSAFMLKSAPGTYPLTLVVTDSLCGSDTLSAQISVYEFPVVDIGSDTLLCPGESIELDAGNPGLNYSWSTGQNTQTIVLTPSETMLVTATVDRNGCSISDEILITMNCSMVFPNAFSPNGDGFNDFFLPHLINMKTYTFMIYNRWGEQVFISTDNGGDATRGWDGTWRGVQQPIGVYVYHAEGVDIKDQPVRAMGSFTLLR